MACAAAVAGCASAGPGAGGQTRENREDKVRLRTTLQRQAPSLPDGFSDKPLPAWRPPFTPDSRACRIVLQTAAGHAPPRALKAQAAATYQGDLLGELVAVNIVAYEPGQAGWRLRELGKSLRECTRLAAGPGTRLRMRPLHMERLGDDSVAASARGRLNGYPYAFNLVLARSGDTVVSVVHTGLAGVEARRTRDLALAFLQ